MLADFFNTIRRYRMLVPNSRAPTGFDPRRQFVAPISCRACRIATAVGGIGWPLPPFVIQSGPRSYGRIGRATIAGVSGAMIRANSHFVRPGAVYLAIMLVA